MSQSLSNRKSVFHDVACLAAAARALALDRVRIAPGSGEYLRCEECHHEWLSHEEPRHGEVCVVGRVLRLANSVAAGMIAAPEDARAMHSSVKARNFGASFASEFLFLTGDEDLFDSSPAESLIEYAMPLQSFWKVTHGEAAVLHQQASAFPLGFAVGGVVSPGEPVLVGERVSQYPPVWNLGVEVAK